MRNALYASHDPSTRGTLAAIEASRIRLEPCEKARVKHAISQGAILTATTSTCPFCNNGYKDLGYHYQQILRGTEKELTFHDFEWIATRYHTLVGSVPPWNCETCGTLLPTTSWARSRWCLNCTVQQHAQLQYKQFMLDDTVFNYCGCLEGCTDRCPCTLSGRECTAGQCICCLDCANSDISRLKAGLVRVGTSTVTGAGFGLFAGQNFRSHAFIGEYTGPLVPSHELKKSDHYTFQVNQDYARNGDSMLRYVNSAVESEEPNVYALVKLCDGEHRIGYWALGNIRKGEELFLVYHDDREPKPSRLLRDS